MAARDTLDPSPCATRSGLAALTSLALLSSLALLFLLHSQPVSFQLPLGFFFFGRRGLGGLLLGRLLLQSRLCHLLQLLPLLLADQLPCYLLLHILGCFLELLPGPNQLYQT
ncbi:MAG: hypothetical protein ACK55Z_08715, partial [bacterium]